MTFVRTGAFTGHPSYESVAGLIDHAILQPALTDAEIAAELESLRQEPLASVCIKPSGVKLAAEMLEGHVAKVCTVVGFPHGVHLPETKAYEAELAFEDGAHEIDMVVNTGKVLGGDWDWVRRDIGGVLEVVWKNSGLLKVIFETDFLPAAEPKIKLCEICSELGVDFVKTSTGFGFVKGGEDGGYRYAGATDEDLALMREHCAPNVGLKASGGIRTLDRLLRVVELGATRVGTTSTKAILLEARERFGPKQG